MSAEAILDPDELYELRCIVDEPTVVVRCADPTGPERQELARRCAALEAEIEAAWDRLLAAQDARQAYITALKDRYGERWANAAEHATPLPRFPYELTDELRELRRRWRTRQVPA